MKRCFVIAALLHAMLADGSCGDAAAQPLKPEGEMRWALYVTLAPQWFDPGEVLGQITPFWVLYEEVIAGLRLTTATPSGAPRAATWWGR
jgi:hypothetical protein